MPNTSESATPPTKRVGPRILLFAVLPVILGVLTSIGLIFFAISSLHEAAPESKAEILTNDISSAMLATVIGLGVGFCGLIYTLVQKRRADKEQP